MITTFLPRYHVFMMKNIILVQIFEEYIFHECHKFSFYAILSIEYWLNIVNNSPSRNKFQGLNFRGILIIRNLHTSLENLYENRKSTINQFGCFI